MIYIGVDPGVSGGIAAINDSRRVVRSFGMPEDPQQLLEQLREIPGHFRLAILEHVRSSPQMGVTSSFTFGRGVGRLERALIAAGLAGYAEVSPIKWQNALACRTGGDKNITKARAQALFPGVKVTHAIADALLLAEYLRLYVRGVRHERNVRGNKGQPNGKEEGESREEEDAIRRAAQGQEAGAAAVKARRREAPPERSRPSTR
jgi:hypothetical protein